MKLVSKISIAFTMLIILIFGIGGVGVAKCACSGKTSLVLPMERGCCPMDSDCMSITVAHISDFELQQCNDVPQPLAVSDCHIVGYTDCRFYCFPENREFRLFKYPHHPPAEFVGTTVLRV